MITPAEATQLILGKTRDFGTEWAPLQKAGGRILREMVYSDRDFPPFTRVAMDGIAIAYSQFAAGRRRFRVAGAIGAGEVQARLNDPEHCLEVMTGAVLPLGCDCVVPYEDIQLEAGMANIRLESLKPGQHVHPQGADKKQGELVLPENRRLFAPEIGLAAAVGRQQLRVARLPATQIIYTGNELVDVAEQPLPHQIRASNPYAIATALSAWGVQADLRHEPDEELRLRQALRESLDHYELLILSGGISKGRFDFVPSSLQTLGVEPLVRQVRQRPAKPFWFGMAPSGCTVFALPGNPVSAFLCTVRYLLPWLRQCLGQEPFLSIFARLETEVTFKKELTYFLEARLRCDEQGQLWARPLPGKGSGDMNNLAEADGFLELPPQDSPFKAGESHRFFPYR